MRYFIDDRILTLGPGALLWAHTDNLHFLLSETPDFDMWVVVITPSILRPARLFPPRFAADIGHPPEARLLEDGLAAELGTVAAALRQAKDPALMTAGLRWWVARAWIGWQDANMVAGRRAHPAVRRAADLLRARPETPLREVARRAGLSLSQLRRVFRSETGLGLTEFRTERRLERVDAIMMRSTVTSLLAAALDAGFGSYSQFYRAFTAIRDTTPKKYYTVEPAGTDI